MVKKGGVKERRKQEKKEDKGGSQIIHHLNMCQQQVKQKEGGVRQEINLQAPNSLELPQPISLYCYHVIPNNT